MPLRSSLVLSRRRTESRVADSVSEMPRSSSDLPHEEINLGRFCVMDNADNGSEPEKELKAECTFSLAQRLRVNHSENRHPTEWKTSSISS